jgi:hypothetical protein
MPLSSKKSAGATRLYFLWPKRNIYGWSSILSRGCELKQSHRSQQQLSGCTRQQKTESKHESEQQSQQVARKRRSLQSRSITACNHDEGIGIKQHPRDKVGIEP